MRMIGHLENEAQARLFSDYLYAQGIDNDIESERGGPWAIWVHAEEELDTATAHLEKFRANPGDVRYQNAQTAAQDRREREQEQERAAQKRYFDRNRLMPGRIYGTGIATAILVGVCVALFILAFLGVELSFLLISSVPTEGGVVGRLQNGLPEVRHGQVWRLFTPILLHGGLLHLLFNMLWLKDLGTMVEVRLGRNRLLIMVLVLAGFSNLGQYIVNGPWFVGMSGVVYGLLGYVWMRGRLDPRSGFHVDRTTMILMTLWFFLCLAGTIPNVANTAHAVGFVAGLLWGYVATLGAR
jgi:GlpG protein